ncbi:hypothetical protein EJ06DRAFT_188041 [Trichodelitschia bisporula]|uniref:Uncharacterized protein n=1 Tax=Trichodelitschia bisporula TaxID=703511 RepID=A0A6G1I723_9PEZI|nr:hypothetical protein EJ06DRAFT_188041 [Trichodelitschia bisporula]
MVDGGEITPSSRFGHYSASGPQHHLAGMVDGGDMVFKLQYEFFDLSNLNSPAQILSLVCFWALELMSGVLALWHSGFRGFLVLWVCVVFLACALCFLCMRYVSCIDVWNQAFVSVLFLYLNLSFFLQSLLQRASPPAPTMTAITIFMDFMDPELRRVLAAASLARGQRLSRLALRVRPAHLGSEQLSHPSAGVFPLTCSQDAGFPRGFSMLRVIGSRFRVLFFLDALEDGRHHRCFS